MCQRTNNPGSALGKRTKAIQLLLVSLLANASLAKPTANQAHRQTHTGMLMRLNNLPEWAKDKCCSLLESSEVSASEVRFLYEWSEAWTSVDDAIRGLETQAAGREVAQPPLTPTPTHREVQPEAHGDRAFPGENTSTTVGSMRQSPEFSDQQSENGSVCPKLVPQSGQTATLPELRRRTRFHGESKYLPEDAKARLARTLHQTTVADPNSPQGARWHYDPGSRLVSIRTRSSSVLGRVVPSGTTYSGNLCRTLEQLSLASLASHNPTGKASSYCTFAGSLSDTSISAHRLELAGSIDTEMSLESAVSTLIKRHHLRLGLVVSGGSSPAAWQAGRAGIIWRVSGGSRRRP